MGSRLELQDILEEVLGSEYVYFQPPTTLQMEYPCIRYERSRINTRFANNNPYKIDKGYTLIAMYYDPDDDLPDRIKKLQKCSFSRHYTQDNLNHDVFEIYY